MDCAPSSFAHEGCEQTCLPIEGSWAISSAQFEGTDMRIRLALIAAAVLASTGCATTDSGETSISLGPIIGLFGMAVDGDDKDDYQHWLDDDDCDCDDSGGLRLSFSGSDDE